jgi:hypothetical protein
MNLRLKPYDLIVKTFVCLTATLAATLIVNRAEAAVKDEPLTAESFEQDSLIQSSEDPAAPAPDAQADQSPDISLDEEVSTLETEAKEKNDVETSETTQQAAISEENEDSLVEDYRNTEGLVEMHYPIDADIPYKQRRPDTAFTFGLTYENFYPSNYSSIIDAADFYQDLFGEAEIPMVSADIGFKYNFTLGALLAGIGGGYGTLSETRGEVLRKVEFTKGSAYLGYLMDSVFDEPYVAPYITGGATIFSISETAGEETASGTTDNCFFYKAGVLVQLNWLEDDTSRKSLIDNGLQNTYLDLFVTQYSTSANEDDTDTETGINFGAGLKLEF